MLNLAHKFKFVDVFSDRSMWSAMTGIVMEGKYNSCVQCDFSVVLTETTLVVQARLPPFYKPAALNMPILKASFWHFCSNSFYFFT